MMAPSNHVFSYEDDDKTEIENVVCMMKQFIGLHLM